MTAKKHNKTVTFQHSTSRKSNQTAMPTAMSHLTQSYILFIVNIIVISY